jgi:hypothetical protein
VVIGVDTLPTRKVKSPRGGHALPCRGDRNESDEKPDAGREPLRRASGGVFNRVCMAVWQSHKNTIENSGGWTRTSDLRIMRPVSYLLLYPAAVDQPKRRITSLISVESRSSMYRRVVFTLV